MQYASDYFDTRNESIYITDLTHQLRGATITFGSPEYGAKQLFPTTAGGV